MNLDKIKEALRSMLVEMNSVKTADGNEITYEGESLEVGVKVNVEDGVYVLEDETELVVKDGVVESLTEKEKDEEPTEEVEEVETSTEEEEPTEETTEPTEEPEEPEEERDDIKDLTSRLLDLEKRLTIIEDMVRAISETPATQPAAEEFKKIIELDEKDKSHIWGRLRK